MNRSLTLESLVGASLLSLSTAATAQTQTYVDLQAGLGYSTNPLLAAGNNTGSGFGRASAFAYYGSITERGMTSVSAYLENSTYFRRYSNKQVFSLSAETSRSVSEKVRLFGSLGLTGDFGAQLSSRFYGVPQGSVAPDPTVPGSLLIVDPNLFGLNQRQYRVSGQVGTSMALSPRDSLTASVGAQHLFVNGSEATNLDYTQYESSLAYDRQINERLTVGGRLIGQYADYSGGRSITSVGPQATMRARLSDSWDATAAVGFVHTRQSFGSDGGSGSSIDLALDGSLCRSLEFQRLCARVSRRTQSSLIGGAPTSTSAGVDYYRRLSAKDTIQLSADVSRSSFRLLGLSQRTTFYSMAGSYDRKINDRLSAGANTSVRKLSNFGPAAKTDIGGSVFVRYRIGDIR